MADNSNNVAIKQEQTSASTFLNTVDDLVSEPGLGCRVAIVSIYVKKKVSIITLRQIPSNASVRISAISVGRMNGVMEGDRIAAKDQPYVSMNYQTTACSWIVASIAVWTNTGFTTSGEKWAMKIFNNIPEIQLCTNILIDVALFRDDFQIGLIATRISVKVPSTSHGVRDLQYMVSRNLATISISQQGCL